MSGVLAVSALAVFAAVCGALIKKGNPEIALLFSIGAAVLVFLYVLPQTEQLAETIGALAEASEMSEALGVLLKALGIEGKRLTIIVREDDINAYLSFRNIPKTWIITPAEANTYDLINNGALIMPADVAAHFGEVLA